ncbi:restriction endonuclease subunit S [Arthrobacter sp.]|uniref:restriction endonuclease subunit S n=1 Tax=Arthrobacter sp. TaxID=1667 RepID=UPI003A93B5DF
MKSRKLGDLAVKTRSLNPAQFPDEEFDLLSIPAYDNGSAEIVRGLEVGSPKQIVSPGDIMIAKIVPRIRRVWIVPQDSHRRQIASGEWIVFRDSTVHASWFRQLLLSERFHGQFMQTVAGVGGSLLRARPTHVHQIRILIPGDAEQRRIADILDAADALRTRRRETIERLDSLSQSMFHEMFGDPVTNDRAWPLQRLDQLGTVDRGVSKHRPRNDPKLLGGDYPLIQTGDVSNADGYVMAASSSYSDFGLQQSKLWPAGTLCITIAANIAKTAVLTFEACFPDSVVGFTSSPARSEFVRHWFGFLQRTIERRAPESAQKNINLAILRGLQVIDPPLELQQEFARRVAAVEHLKSKHRAQLAELENLFLSLQDRAFKGEL